MAGPITDDPTFLTAIPFQDHVLEALHYGREHGLLKNLDVDFIAHQISTIPTTDTDGVTSDGHLACFEPPSVTPVAEGWYMPNAAATMIHRACRMPTEKEVEDLANLACHLSHAKAMKLELPALQSDNGLDYQRMCASISTRQQALVDSHRLPLEPTNLEADEGMQFPTAVRRCGPILMEQIEKETIDVSKEAFQYLANQLRVNWTDDDQRQLLSYELEYKRVGPSLCVWSSSMGLTLLAVASRFGQIRAACSSLYRGSRAFHPNRRRLHCSNPIRYKFLCR